MLFEAYGHLVGRYAWQIYDAFGPHSLLGALKKRTRLRRLSHSLADYAGYRLFGLVSRALHEHKEHEEQTPLFLTSLVTSLTWQFTGAVSSEPPEVLFVAGGTFAFHGIDKYVAYERRNVSVPDKASWLLALEVAEIVTGTLDIAVIVPASTFYILPLALELQQTFAQVVFDTPPDPAALAAVKARSQQAGEDLVKRLKELH